MKEIIRHSAVILLIAAGIATTANRALAEDIELIFTGTIANTCNFSAQSAGTLVHNPNEGTLSTRHEEGVPASVSVSCTGPATISVSGPTTEISYDNYLVEATRIRRNGNTQFVRNSSDGNRSRTVSTRRAINNRSFNVDLELSGIDRNSNGDYTATVTLTAAPN